MMLENIQDDSNRAGSHYDQLKLFSQLQSLLTVKYASEVNRMHVFSAYARHIPIYVQYDNSLIEIYSDFVKQNLSLVNSKSNKITVSLSLIPKIDFQRTPQSEFHVNSYRYIILTFLSIIDQVFY